MLYPIVLLCAIESHDYLHHGKPVTNSISTLDFSYLGFLNVSSAPVNVSFY